ncbi:uncharacterized protein LOC143036290 [Oratosquilla oratoria]|uniref:uncharacterized protein LOC143036290 n=1 Tax=Oratosquilla oratoria TaxID=337810 RepID=UPI003F761DD5
MRPRSGRAELSVVEGVPFEEEPPLAGVGDVIGLGTAIVFFVGLLSATRTHADADADADADAALVSHHGTPYTPQSHRPTTPYPAHRSYTPAPPTYHPRPVHRTPTYAPHPAPVHPTPTYAPRHAPVHRPPTYAQRHPSPSPYHAAPAPASYKACPDEKPRCSYNTTRPWCLYDPEYPEYEVSAAAKYHKDKLLSLYADVADLDTSNSVNRPDTIYEETYLCPSETSYSKLLRAVNTDGRWRVIVNNIKVDYELLTQTTRLEECTDAGRPCPLVPHCHESKCLQKSAYHRFLVYDPCDEYFPFAIESFRLPATCACFLGTSYIDH